MTLDRYPYGCAEQTTSRALPLLYVSELAAGAGMKDEPELKERIQDAIYRVLNYQSSSGQLRPLGSGLGRPLARRLCHRLPDPGAREGLRRAGAGDDAGAQQSAELAGLRRRPARTAAPRSPMRSTCSPATRRRRSATCATIPTRSSKPFRARWRWRSSPRALRSTATAQRSEATFTAALQLAKSTSRATTGTAPTTARGCATAPRCWRLPPKASRRRRWCRS